MRPYQPLLLLSVLLVLLSVPAFGQNYDDYTKEQVKCIFSYEDPAQMAEQKCYLASEDSIYSCSGKGSCLVVDSSGEPYVHGLKGTKLEWKSTCGGNAYTTVDGASEYANFKCSSELLISKESTCTEDDGGKTYSQAGSVKWDGKVYTDECRESTYTGKKDGLTEYYCTSENGWSSHTIKCTDGCENNACLSENILVPSCSDDEPGVLSILPGTVKSEYASAGADNLWHDYCSTSDSVGEFYCTQDDVQGFSQKFITCESGKCDSGQCIQMASGYSSASWSCNDGYTYAVASDFGVCMIDRGWETKALNSCEKNGGLNKESLKIGGQACKFEAPKTVIKAFVGYSSAKWLCPDGRGFSERVDSCTSQSDWYEKAKKSCDCTPEKECEIKMTGENFYDKCESTTLYSVEQPLTIDSSSTNNINHTVQCVFSNLVEAENTCYTLTPPFSSPMYNCTASSYQESCIFDISSPPYGLRWGSNCGFTNMTSTLINSTNTNLTHTVVQFDCRNETSPAYNVPYTHVNLTCVDGFQTTLRNTRCASYFNLTQSMDELCSTRCVNVTYVENDYNLTYFQCGYANFTLGQQCDSSKQPLSFTPSIIEPTTSPSSSVQKTSPSDKGVIDTVQLWFESIFSWTGNVIRSIGN